MAIRRESIGKQIDRISRLKLHQEESTGFFYNSKSELATKRHKYTVVGLFVSDENTFLVRPHVFERKEKMTYKQFDAWLAEHYGKILRDNILPGMEVRTDKQWRLYRIIGVFPNDSTGLVRTKTRGRRNKAKSPRG